MEQTLTLSLEREYKPEREPDGENVTHSGSLHSREPIGICFEVYSSVLNTARQIESHTNTADPPLK